MSLAAKYGKKFILITSFGCGDSWDNLSDKEKMLFGDKVKYKTLSEVWLQLSASYWKIIIPVGLSDSVIEGKTIVMDNQELPRGYNNRVYLAKALIDIVTEPYWNNREISMYIKDNNYHRTDNHAYAKLMKLRVLK